MREGLRIGLALCGSYCTYERALTAAKRLVDSGADVTALMSENAAGSDSRFGRAGDFIARLETLTGRPVMHSIAESERVGPDAMFEVLVIAPCTGNTLGKLASGITDTAVTMAAKSHLRNGSPLVIALSTNDGLSGAAGSIAALLCRKNYYFVPFGQDDPIGKPYSLSADFGRLNETIDAALRGRQLQPILLRH